MKQVREGNDISVIWSIMSNDAPVNLGGYELSLYLTSKFEKKKLTDFKANGNKISWTFYGKDQNARGTYTLTLVLNEGKEDMHTIDACNFIELVACTCKLTDGVDNEGMQTEVVNLESTFDFVSQSSVTIVVDSELSETSENPVQNKVVTGALNGLKEEVYGTVGEALESMQGALRQDINKKQDAQYRFTSIDGFQDFVRLAEDYPLTDADIEAFLSGRPIVTRTESDGVIPATSVYIEGDEYAILEFLYRGEMYRIYCDLVGKKIVGSHSTITPVQEKLESGKNVKTINGESLLGSGNIVIPTTGGGGSYDDTEIREQLTELSAENERLKERIEEQDQFIEDLQNTKIEKENDDYYPKMAVGTADNLAGVDEVDSEFNFRRSGGGAITDGVARVQSIKGNSVVWNQLYPTGWSSTREGITSTSVNGKISAVGTTTTTYFRFEPFSENIANHIYLFMISGASSTLEGKRFGLLNRGGEYFGVVTQGSAYLFYLNNNVSAQRNVGIKDLQEGITLNENLVVNQYDLTKMFGSGNEPTTIEEFYKRIPMGVDLNAHNEGEVINMKATGIKSVGRNAWDGTLEQGKLSNGEPSASTTHARSVGYISALPNSAYFFYSKDVNTAKVYFYVSFYDSEKKFISEQKDIYNKAISTPSNASYMRFYVWKSDNVVIPLDYSNICINLSDTSINGKYYPYIKKVEDLSIIRKYFPQGMKSAGTTHDAIRYNKATNRWEKVVRIGEVDFGDLEWLSYKPEGTFNVFYSGANPFPASFNNDGKNILCKKYSAVSKGAVDFANHEYKLFAQTNAYPRLYIRDDDYTDTASFKAAMKGVMLYYELAEPIVTEIEEKDFNLDYSVWNCGTEQAIAEGKSSALAADITYGFNAVGLIKQLRSLVESMAAKLANL